MRLYVIFGPLFMLPVKVSIPVQHNASAPIRFSLANCSMFFPIFGNLTSVLLTAIGTLRFSRALVVTSLAINLFSAFQRKLSSS